MSTADKKARENISVLISEMGELILNDDQKEIYGWLEKDVKKIGGSVVHVPKKTTQNFIRILTYDENTKIYRRNSFTGKLERTNIDPQRPWCKSDTAILKTYIEKYYGLACSTKFNDAFTIMTSNCYGYHPIVNILNKEKWDGKPHCQRFFIDYFGAEDTAYNKEVSRLIFCGAINRILNPGCKWDYLPVLIGKQGSGKSTITRWLALQDEFYTSVKTIKGKRGEESIQSV